MVMLGEGLAELRGLLETLLLLVNHFHFVLSCSLLELPLKRRIIVILDVIVCATRQMLRNLAPAVSIRLM